MAQQTVSFQAELWLYPDPGGWHFITVPADVAGPVVIALAHLRKGWGSIPLLVTIGQTEWKTSMFPAKEKGSYVLPVKADVRRKESLEAGDTVTVSLRLT